MQKDKRVTIRIPEALLEQVKKKALELNTSDNDVYKFILDSYFKGV